MQKRDNQSPVVDKDCIFFVGLRPQCFLNSWEKWSACIYPSKAAVSLTEQPSWSSSIARSWRCSRSHDLGLFGIRLRKNLSSVLTETPRFLASTATDQSACSVSSDQLIIWVSFEFMPVPLGSFHFCSAGSEFFGRWRGEEIRRLVCNRGRPFSGDRVRAG